MKDGQKEANWIDGISPLLSVIPLTSQTRSTINRRLFVFQCLPMISFINNRVNTSVSPLTQHSCGLNAKDQRCRKQSVGSVCV